MVIIRAVSAGYLGRTTIRLSWLVMASCWLLALVSASAAEVTQVTWPTAHASEPPALPAGTSAYLPAFRLALHALPEASTIALALRQPALLNLTAEQAARLRPLTAERYRLMAQSPAYAPAKSALAYCYSERKPAQGLASVYRPDGAGATTETILFLHGHGGSFLWYQHYLSELFPDRIIICPAYGISTATIPAAYVTECLAACSQQLRITLKTPTLIGLSAGGYGACQVYAQSPNSFSQLICLASSPPEDALSRFPTRAAPRFLSGASEPFVLSSEFPSRIRQLQRTCPGAQAATIPGADHVFLLTHREATTAYLRAWISPAP